MRFQQYTINNPTIILALTILRLQWLLSIDNRDYPASKTSSSTLSHPSSSQLDIEFLLNTLSLASITPYCSLCADNIVMRSHFELNDETEKGFDPSPPAVDKRVTILDCIILESFGFDLSKYKMPTDCHSCMPLMLMTVIHGQSFTSLHSAQLLCFFLATSTGEPPTTQILSGMTSQIHNELDSLGYGTEDGSRTKHLTSFLVMTNSNCSKITRSVYLSVNFWENVLLRVLERLNFIFIYDPGDVRSKEELKLVEAIYPIISIFYEVPNIVLLLTLIALRFWPLFGMAFQPLHPNFEKHITFIACFDKYVYSIWTIYAINSIWWKLLVRYKLQWMFGFLLSHEQFQFAAHFNSLAL